MAPKRATRTSSGRTSTGGQGTLSFGRDKPNRITKPTTSPRGKSTKKDPSSLAQAQDAAAAPAVADVAAPIGPPAAEDPLITAPETTNSVLGGRATPEASDEEPEINEQEAADDVTARALPLSKIKTYWRTKEQARLAPRVHQADLPLAEKILREWDMSGQFGPCIGISRMGRWRRARRLGLEPPFEVLGVLLGRLDGEEKRREKVEERAYVDVLMGNRVEVGA